MSDVVERSKAALKALDAETYGGSAESGALRRIARENQFIAQARTLVPELVAEVERLRAGIERVRDVVEQHATRGIGQRILDALVVPDE
ncbi:hypothetical protein [Mycolicibacterium peregrinum]|uniref:hypothetical protein n=1 Tax=Mycolicibacterium peregrinum TaxID=43304 RepID=UPI000A539C6A|nr:hypothetical protein [Mycolicibacterium peregrinum]